MAETINLGDAISWPYTRVYNFANGATAEADQVDDEINKLGNFVSGLRVLANNSYNQAKNVAGTAFNVYGINAVDVFTLGHASLVTNILGSTVQINGTAVFTNPMTTAGDVIYGGVSGAATRLAVGAANTALVSNGTNPAWTAIVNSLAGTTNQVAVSAATGTITLSLPQSIHTGATPTFAGLTLAGALALADNLLTRPELKDYSETIVVANTGANYALNFADGNVYDLTLTANCTFTITNPPATAKNGSMLVYLTQDATGSRTVTWPAAMDWAGGTAPTLTTTAAGLDIIVLTTRNGGTSYQGGTYGLAFS